MWNSWGTKRRPVGVLWAALLLLTGCGLVPAAPGQEDIADPPGPVLYTATGSVRTLLAAPDGRLWAATGGGGVLCWDQTDNPPHRWTTREGLASNDVRSVTADGDGVLVTTTAGRQRITKTGAISPCIDSNVQTVSEEKPAEKVPATLGTITGRADNRQGTFLATSFGLWHRTGAGWHALPLPAGSPASHVGAMAAGGATSLIAGLYGDGVYRRAASGQWTRLPDQPDTCRHPTALAVERSGLLVGTQEGAVWQEKEGRWWLLPSPSTLPGMNINSLTAFRGALWASTFDSGLLRVSGESKRTFTAADGMSSPSPRDLTVFHGTLYARHADGALDCSADGVSWHPAFSHAQMPRAQVYALSAGSRLLLGGWAGWSAMDGKNWERHFHDPELAGQVVTAIAEQGGAVWIGTQKQGLLRFQGGHYTRFQEQQGLTDDWVTCLATRGDRLLVGTYTGGLLERQGERFSLLLDPAGFAVRAVAFDPQTGNALAATPLGVYREEAGHWVRMDTAQSGGTEAQAVLASEGGMWCATRTSLAFVPRDTASR